MNDFRHEPVASTDGAGGDCADAAAAAAAHGDCSDRLREADRLAAALRARLARSDLQYRRLFKASPQPMWVFDVETLRFLAVNDAALEKYGYQREQFLAMSIADIRPAEDLDRLRDSVARGRELPIHTAGLWRHRRCDGSLIDVEITSHAVLFDEREAQLVIAHDVTARLRAEAAVRESARFAQSTLDTLSAHIAIVDAGGRIVAVNRAWREFARRNGPPDAAVCEGADYLAACDAATGVPEAGAFAAAIRAVLRGDRSSFSIEYACHSPTEHRWFVGRVSRMVGDGPSHVVVSHEDITQRQMAELEQAAREQQFRATFEQAAVGLAHVAPNGRWLRVNQRLCDIVGYNREELLARSFQDITHPDDLDGDLEQVRRVLAGEIATYALEKRYVRKDGAPVWIDHTVALVRRDDGTPEYFVSVVEDITERKRAQQALAGSEKLVRAVLETLPVGVWLLDASGRIVDSNPAGRRIWAGERQVGIDQFGEYQACWADSGRRIDAREWAAARAIERGETSLDELIDIQCFDGTRKTILNSAVPMRDAAGTITGAIVVNQDVTELRAAQRRVEESEQRLRLALQAAQQGIYDLNVQTGATIVTPEYARMLGYEPGEFVESNAAWIARLHPDDREPVARTYRDYVDGRLPEYRVEFRQRTKDGNWRWILSMGCVIERDADGRPLRMLGTHTDITDRKQAEEALRKFYLAVEQSSESIVICDLQARIEYVNEAFTRVSGYTRDEVLGRNPRLLQSGRTPRATYEAMWKALTAGRRWQGELSNRRRDGSEYIEAASISPIRQADGTVTHYLAVKEDISEKRRVADELENYRQHLEELVESRTRQLEQMRRQAEAASEAKSAFLANMSHEIRTPMNGVLGMLEVLEQTALTEQQAELVRTASDSGRTLLGIIDDILDFSKIEAGRLRIDSAPIDVAELTEQLAESLVPVAEQRGVDFSVFVSPAIGAPLDADALRLRQILFNLIGNALKFSGGRTGRRGRVSLRVEVAAAAPLRLRFVVTDDGIGMTAAQVERLFEPFSQAEASTTRRYGGTGLGLSICKRLADLMAGEITVASAPGAGSTFTLTLPVGDGAAQPIPPPRRLDGVCCVVVESPAIDVDGVCAYLAHAGAKVLRVADIAAAFRSDAVTGGTPLLLHHARRREAVALTLPAPWRQLALAPGRRRRPRLASPQCVTLDSAAMRRDALLYAVAVAVGRASPEEPLVPPGADPGHVSAPSVAEARRRGELLLVAEDDEINRKVIARQLALLGRTAEFAVDGAEALRMWQHGGYALLLTDLHMPRMDGYSLTAEIRRREAGREHGPTTRIPIVALTANALRGEAERARAIGMDEFLTKPLQLQLLREALARWLPAAAGADGAATARDDSAVDFDPAALASLIGEEPAVIREFLSFYLASAPAMRLDFAQACARGDLALAGGCAHKLKSTARTVGAAAALAPRVDSALQRIEAAIETHLAAGG